MTHWFDIMSLSYIYILQHPEQQLAVRKLAAPNEPQLHFLKFYFGDDTVV